MPKLLAQPVHYLVEGLAFGQSPVNVFTYVRRKPWTALPVEPVAVLAWFSQD